MTVDEIFLNAVQSWRANNGIGTMLCPLPLNNKIPLLLILQRIYSRSPTSTTTIAVENFKDRLDLMEFLTTQDDEKNNEEFKELFKRKSVRIITRDFISSGRYFGYPLFGIIYNIENINTYIREWFNRCKFKLVVLNKIVLSLLHITDYEKDNIGFVAFPSVLPMGTGNAWPSV